MSALRAVEPPSDDRVGIPGAEEWVTADALRIDPAYQRTVSLPMVRRISREFDPAAFGRLVVVERGDGEKYVVDGQHRLAAVRRKGWGHKAVPCIVYRGLTPRDEAALFYKPQAAGARRPLTPHDLLRARLASGDPDAEAMVRIAQAEGFRLSGQEGAGNLRAIAAVEHIYRRGEPDDLAYLLGLIGEAWGPEAAGIHATVLRGLFLFHARYRGQYQPATLIGKLQGVLPRRLKAGGDERARVLGVAGSASVGVAQAVRALYNKGRTKTRLAPWGDAR